MRPMNSLRSMQPEPSTSIRIICCLTSSFFRKIPRAFMASRSSATSMVPDLSLSKRKKALSISSHYSSEMVFMILFIFLNIRFFLYIMFPMSSKRPVSTYLKSPVNLIYFLSQLENKSAYFFYFPFDSFSRPLITQRPVPTLFVFRFNIFSKEMESI